MQELTRAENETRAEKFIQGQRFIEKNFMSQKGNTSVQKNSCLSKLDPVLQHGMLSIGDRLGKSVMPEHVKHPVIIPKDSYVTTLILRDIREKIGHCGRNRMLSKVRQLFASVCKLCCEVIYFYFEKFKVKQGRSNVNDMVYCLLV